MMWLAMYIKFRIEIGLIINKYLKADMKRFSLVF